MSQAPHYGARRDEAEAGVVKAFEAGGATVAKINGKDVPDLLVGFLRQTHLVEVKTDNAQLRKGQAEFARTWLGSPVVVARTPAQARKWLKVWRERMPTLSTVLRAEHEAQRVAGIPFDEVLERQLKDPEFRRHYEARRSEHEAVRAGPWQGPHVEGEEPA